MEKNEKYSIGLDLGTNSVGWAVADNNNNLLKFRGKNMFGVRLFDDAKTAAERRGFRSVRRRLARRKERIRLLREIFEPEITKVDSDFYLRLNESFLHQEDRKLKNKSTLFNGDLFKSDKEYYEIFPTIYHLRNELMTTTEKKDIRLIYLALHHTIKYRGNFLYEGTNFNIENVKVDEKLQLLFDFLEEELDCEFENNKTNTNKIIGILSEDKTKTEKEEQILSLLKATKDSKKMLKELFKAILNKKFSLNKIFLLEGNDISIYINDFGEKSDEIEEYLGEWYEYFTIIDEIYQWTVLKNILSEGNNISEAMIKKYKKHGKDLKILKKLSKQCGIYNDVFRDKGKSNKNYHYYINEPRITSAEDFYKNIKKQFQPFVDELKNDLDYEYMISSIEMENFLPKITSKDNGAIPYQLHKNELEKIIENQSKHYSFLKETKKRIVNILEFRVPYYVGPLNVNSEFTTIVKTKDEKIYPWNFDEIVDKYSSSLRFMEERIGNCTYLPQYKVMPKHSLTNSLFGLLNELNKVRINNKLIDVEVKKSIIRGLFQKQKKVSEKAFKDFLFKNNLIESKDVQITGYQDDKAFASTLSSWIDFAEIFGEFDFGEKLKIEKYEKIILMITMIQDKEILSKIITKEHPDITEEQLKKILSKRYSGFSNLSKEFIDEKVYVSDSFGEVVTILDQLYNSTLNLMQILSDDKLGFKEAYEKIMVKPKMGKITYDDILEIPGSPAIKRGIWQTVQIIDEIVKIMGYEPDNIFIEIAREKGKAGRTSSRVKRMLDLYKKIVEETNEYNEAYQELKNIEKEKRNLDDRALYLYFIQGGKCMYTGQKLDINNLDKYEIDHIIPRWVIKDDSFDNLALVTHEANQEKGEQLGVPEQFRHKQYYVWETMLKYALITRKKFSNLKKSKFSEKDIEVFINRQLVETRQITKHVLNLFKSSYSKTDIVVLRPNLLSDFRKQFKFYKIRELNDLHHAHDALISCFVGNYILNRFPKMSSKYIYDEYLKFKEKNEFKHGAIISSMKKDFENHENNFIWNTQEQIRKFANYFKYKNCNITKKIEEGSGKFYKQLPLKKGTSNKLIPLKSSKELNPKKYGGYTGENPAYFLAIKYKKGKKLIKELVTIPIHIKKLIETGQTTELEYLKSSIDGENLKIISKKILKNQYIKWGKDYFYIVSTDELHNAKQLFLEEKHYNMLYCIKELDEYLLNELYLYIVNKMQYYNVFENTRKKLLDFNNKFINLTKEDKKDVIYEILKITKCNAVNANLKKYGGPERLGRIQRAIQLDQIIFIHQSITGLYEIKRKI
ncbi:MAG TPA: type II CRISPR RNA-guided endonuclease Cas9 [Gallicola sp.]|nr:type II CRISPR RNA-guided endonuclease Cas9 [Gallicola sp.]